MAQKHAGGRPLKFRSVKILQEKIDAYFADCDPHWVEEVYWDHPFKDSGEGLEDQPHGGSLKRRWASDRDYTQPMTEQTRRRLTDQVPYTITGLAIALETSRNVLLDYESGNRDLKPEDEAFDPDIPKFSNTIKAAKLRCENYAELYLYQGKNTVGAIFNLKNNHRWKDTQEVDNGDQTITIITRNAGSAAASPPEEVPDDDN